MDIRFPGRHSKPRPPGNEEEWQTSAQDCTMVIKWSWIWKALRFMLLFTFEDTEVFEIRPITASYLPALEALEIPQISKPICWMKMSATNFLVVLHLFWHHLMSVTRRYAVAAARRRVFLWQPSDLSLLCQLHQKVYLALPMRAATLWSFVTSK